MEETLVKKSNILFEKTKFFLIRIFTFFSFLLLPVWIQKSMEINIVVQSLMMLFFLIFMAAQWYLLGKEIDYRFKIYFRANSTVDRILYRLIMGFSAMIIVYNLMAILPSEIVHHFFWGFFIVLGIFYSWPTRGKIIQESVATQFSEYKYLDSFEKTVLLISVLVFFVSLPSFPFLSNLETYKLIIDPEERINIQMWNYLQFNFFPFRRFPHLMNLGWSMHVFFVSLGFYLMAFYGTMRFFLSRRLSLLGIFALVSSWSFSLILKRDPYSCLYSTFSLIWIWSILWCVKSATYRSGLMYGLLCYLGVLINYNFVFLFPLGLGFLYFSFLKETTQWFRLQFVKYSFLGLVLIIMTILLYSETSFLNNGYSLNQFFNNYLVLIKRKAFFSLSILGLITLFVIFVSEKFKLFQILVLDLERLKQLMILIFCISLYGILGERDLVKNFSLLWILVVFSLLPLEWVFQSLSRLRSRRNFIYAVYILICLLDSHIEGRFKIIYNFFNSPPEIIDLNNREHQVKF